LEYGRRFQEQFLQSTLAGVYGLPLESMQGYGWKETVHPEDLLAHEGKWRRCLESGEPFEAESRIRGADGSYRWFLDRNVPLRDETGRVVRWYGANADIDECKQSQEKLRQQEETLQEVMDVVPQHMYIVQTDANSAFRNRAAVEYFDIVDPTEPIRQREVFQKFAHPEDRDRLLEEFERAGKTGIAIEVEGRMRGKNDHYRWFLHQLFPLRDAEGNVVRWCGTRIDIEERKIAQESTQRENLALREEIAKVSMFEEIVGTSRLLQAALVRVSKVARTEVNRSNDGPVAIGIEQLGMQLQTFELMHLDPNILHDAQATHCLREFLLLQLVRRSWTFTRGSWLLPAFR
jgi:PAS domain S-box-containing protein